MSTKLIEVITRANGVVEYRPVSIVRPPLVLDNLVKSRRIDRVAGDLAVSDTTFASDLTGFSGSFNLASASKLWIAAHVIGKAASNSDKLSLTLFLDGINIAGGGGLSHTETNKPSNLGFTFLSDVLAAGVHTFALRAKVGTLPGTLYASGANAPMALSTLVLEGEA